jgi:hypothetical protein
MTESGGLDLEGMVRGLAEGGVRFVIGGGLALAMHGSAHVTLDLDVIVDTAPDNLVALERVVSAWAPVFRSVPGEVPVPVADVLRSGVEVLTTTTTRGDIDLFVRMAGVGNFADATRGASQSILGGQAIAFLSITQLLAAKRAAGRPKDIAHIHELEAIRALTAPSPD